MNLEAQFLSIVAEAYRCGFKSGSSFCNREWDLVSYWPFFFPGGGVVGPFLAAHRAIARHCLKKGIKSSANYS